jgi:hypothetical protein
VLRIRIRSDPSLFRRIRIRIVTSNSDPDPVIYKNLFISNFRSVSTNTWLNRIFVLLCVCLNNVKNFIITFQTFQIKKCSRNEFISAIQTCSRNEFISAIQTSGKYLQTDKGWTNWWCILFRSDPNPNRYSQARSESEFETNWTRIPKHFEIDRWTESVNARLPNRTTDILIWNIKKSINSSYLFFPKTVHTK